MENTFKIDKRLEDVSETVMHDVLGAKPGEYIVILANPEEAPLSIAESLFNAAVKYEVEPAMIVQKKRSSKTAADPRVLAAFSTAPDIFASLSTLSIGYDSGFNVFGQEFKPPYKFEGVERDRVLDMLRYARRGFWSPYVNEDMWIRAVPVDYQEMRALGEKIAAKLTNAKDVHVTTEKGTDVTFSCDGMICEPSTGPYDKKGYNGNLPTGEDEITPKPGTTNGKIVFDGGFGGLSCGNLALESPIDVYIEDGKVVDIKGGREAEVLSKELDFFTSECFRRAEKEGFDANVYASNVRNIGEAAIGLNKKAKLIKSSSILEWEKALRTSHFAIGFDWGANSREGPTINQTLNHFDGVVKKPTITANGELIIDKGWYLV